MLSSNQQQKTWQLCSGNKMVVQGALTAGCQFFSGYPITPSSEIYAEMMRKLPNMGGIALGAPDEISAISYVIGASLTGAKAMTATSGPGFSLMIETVQYAIMTETPLVIVVVQRLGPATGGATQGAQGDIGLVAHANSGGYTIPVLSPIDAYDCYALTIQAFSLAEQLRTPVIVLSDKEVATTVETLDLSSLPSIKAASRTMNEENKPHIPYFISCLEDVPLFAPVGGKQKTTVTGSAHNQYGQLKKNDPETIRQLKHLESKIMAKAQSMEQVRYHKHPNAKTLIISYGISARTCRQVKMDLDPLKIPVSFLEVLCLFPIPVHSINQALDGMSKVVIVEENLTGLYAKELKGLLKNVDIVQVNNIGKMISPAMIKEALV